MHPSPLRTMSNGARSKSPKRLQLTLNDARFRCADQQEVLESAVDTPAHHTLTYKGLVLPGHYDCLRVRLPPPATEAARAMLRQHEQPESPVVCLEPGVLSARAVYHLWTCAATEAEISECREVMDRRRGSDVCPRQECFRNHTLASAVSALYDVVQPPPPLAEVEAAAAELEAPPEVRRVLVEYTAQRWLTWTAVAESWGWPARRAPLAPAPRTPHDGL